MRLIRELDYLTFDEAKIFALQLTDYRKYTTVKNKILKFRKEKGKHAGKYKEFMRNVWDKEIVDLFIRVV
jgi:recombinational DNA repair ATPase RecF